MSIHDQCELDLRRAEATIQQIIERFDACVRTYGGSEYDMLRVQNEQLRQDNLRLRAALNLIAEGCKMNANLGSGFISRQGAAEIADIALKVRS